MLSKNISMSLASIGAQSLTEGVVEQLRSAILDGRYQPGQKLPTEAVLGAQMQVSRSVLREALSHLKAEGLIISRQGKGSFIADRSEASSLRFSREVPKNEALQHWFELRVVVEIGAAACAASARTSVDMAAIKAALDAIDAAIAGGTGGGDADVEFHFAIAKATHNPYFTDLLDFLQTRLTEKIANSWRNSSATGHGPYPAQQEHRKMFEAIKAGDVEAAREAARNHLQNAALRLGLKAP